MKKGDSILNPGGVRSAEQKSSLSFVFGNRFQTHFDMSLLSKIYFSKFTILFLK